MLILISLSIAWCCNYSKSLVLSTLTPVRLHLYYFCMLANHFQFCSLLKNKTPKKPPNTNLCKSCYKEYEDLILADPLFTAIKCGWSRINSLCVHHWSLYMWACWNWLNSVTSACVTYCITFSNQINCTSACGAEIWN